jgi:hypothetical protein
MATRRRGSAGGAVGEGDEREHDRDLDEHADDGGQRRAGLEAEQADRHGDGELEEVGGADEGRRRGDVVREPPEPWPTGRRAEDPVALDDQRHGDQARSSAAGRRSWSPGSRTAARRWPAGRGCDAGLRRRRSCRARPGRWCVGQRAAGGDAREQRDHDVEDHRQQQRRPRDDDVGDAEQERGDRGERDDHDRGR